MAARSLAARSLAAVALMLGFYVLALAIAAGLLYVPYAEWHYAGRLHLKLAVACVLGAAAIGWGILPRRDAFPAPGPRLEPRESPRLFRVLGDVARRTRQEMPVEVYLVSEMNAWVANRGGVMGFGSRRVMGLGLPLLQVASVDELEAILAHEFGHYHGGDTRLGPWIYKTRSAIGRTLQSLGDESWLQVPFRWYGSFFMRITQAISRAQELTADQLAATTVGAASLVEGLKKVHATAGAFDAYWQQEALPVLGAGFHAPLADGFARFLRSPRIADAVHRTLAEELAGGRADPYDSHPPLRDRIAAVQSVPARAASAPRAYAPAIELLGDVAACERRLLEFGFRGSDGGQPRFRSLAWDDVTREIYVPSWRTRAGRIAPLLGTATLEQLPRVLSARGQELARAALERDEHVPEEHLPQVLAGAVGACVATRLVDAGWTPSADPGEPVTVSRNGASLEPFGAVARLQTDPDGAAWWASVVEQHGIGGLTLAPSAKP